MKFFSDTYKIANREIIRYIRDKNLLLVFLIAPLLYPVLYSFVYVNKTESKIPVALLDEDNSYLSRELTRDINALQNVRIVKLTSEPDSINYDLATSKYHGYVIIPKNFEKNLKRGIRQSIPLIVSDSRLLVLSDIGFPLSQTVTTFSIKASASFMGKKGVPVFQNPLLAQPLKFDFRSTGNPYLTYGDMILPPLIIIILCQLITIGTATSSAGEWSFETWKDILIEKKYNYFSIFLAKLILPVSLFMSFIAIIRLIVVPYFVINIAGAYFDFLLVNLTGLTAAAAFGLMLGTFIKHRVTVFVFLGFTTYPFFLSSGYVWPSEQLPIAVRALSYLFPSTPYLQMYYKVTQLNLPIVLCSQQVVHLTAITILYGLLFIFRISKIKRKIIFAESGDK